MKFKLLLLLIISNISLAESFGNNSFFIPKLGVAIFDTIGLNKKPWGVGYQLSFGASYMHAIDYNWWWVTETSMSFGKIDQPHRPYLSTITGGTGVRFDLLSGDIRPNISLLVHYLHFLGNGVRYMPIKLDWPIFVGLKSVIGLEYFFYSELSLMMDMAHAIYLNINEPFRQALYASISFAVYF